MSPFIRALVATGLGIVEIALVLGCAGCGACGILLLVRRQVRDGAACLILAACAGAALHAFWGAPAEVGP